MKHGLLTIISIFLLLVSCGKREVRSTQDPLANIHYGQLPKVVQSAQTSSSKQSKKNSKPAKKQAKTFEQIFLSFKKGALPSKLAVDPKLIEAFQGELFSQNLDRKKELLHSFSLYTNLIEKYPAEKSFLALRAGKTLLRLKDLDRASRYLYRAFLDSNKQTRTSELWFAISQVQKYKEHNLKKALTSALKVNPKDVSSQEYWVYVAELYNELGDFKHAESAYQKAIIVSPERFLIQYDLLPFYVQNHAIQKDKTYLSRSYKYLMSLSNTQFHRKALSQKIWLNKMAGIETFDYKFSLSNHFIYHPKLLYYLRTPRIHNRRWSATLPIPVPEQNKEHRGPIYYNLMEDIWNNGNQSSFTLLEARPAVVNIASDFTKGRSRKRRIYFHDPIFIQLLPTNNLILSTNTNVDPMSEPIITTNENDLLWMTNLQIQHVIDIKKMDGDNDNTWDYTVIGIVASNEVSFTLISPKNQSIRTWTAWIETSSARLVVQDVDQDGQKDWYLLDKGIRLLNPPVRP